jgi:Hsp70 protein
MTAQYVLGFDLGTTNCVLGYTPLDGDEPDVRLLEIPQLVAPDTLESRTSLPSFLYLAAARAAGHDGLDLPWAEGRKYAVGELSRRQSAEMPERTVAAAKSWLCHSRVDRRQPILPWNAPDDVDKVSPVAAARIYLEHLIAVWHATIPDAPVAEQKVILTVPASFDAAARDLTREAALSAGLPSDLVLVEEPQAAVYAWLDACGDQWRNHLKPGDKLLVCDVGGGTTDLTLIDVTEEKGELALVRLAVGNHLLVGGDNMDLALAHHVAGAFADKGVQLDAWQSVSLWHAARNAKETLLADAGPDQHPISVLGRGSRVIGGTVSVDVQRDEVANLLADGFFPHCQRTDRPQRSRVSGFQEIGLPFESNTAITQHLAEFLGVHSATDGAIGLPSRVLFNGGVFKASRLRSRLLDVLRGWCDTDSKTCELEGERDLDNAVARGAAYYGWVKQHQGVRIHGGVARSYYVGIETAGLAIPGAPRPLRALCVVPFGMEEGHQIDVPSGEIGVVLGEPAHFRFFSSASRKQDQPGDVLERWSDDELIETDSLETVLSADDEIDQPYVPVRFQTRITELGVFELWCVSTTTDQRWKLEFSVRESA